MRKSLKQSAICRLVMIDTTPENRERFNDARTAMASFERKMPDLTEENRQYVLSSRLSVSDAEANDILREADKRFANGAIGGALARYRDGVRFSSETKASQSALSKIERIR